VEDNVDAVLAELSFKRRGTLDALFIDVRISPEVPDCRDESRLHCIRCRKPESATLAQTLVSRGRIIHSAKHKRLVLEVNSHTSGLHKWIRILLMYMDADMLQPRVSSIVKSILLIARYVPKTSQ
jgi:hypothetical protein